MKREINLLNEYFNSKSDANEFLEASEQEKMEKDFQEWFKEKNTDFEFLSRFVIKYLAENHHPHTYILVTSTNAQILESIKSTGSVYDYLSDFCF